MQTEARPRSADVRESQSRYQPSYIVDNGEFAIQRFSERRSVRVSNESRAISTNTLPTLRVRARIERR